MHCQFEIEGPTPDNQTLTLGPLPLLPPPDKGDEVLYGAYLYLVVRREWLLSPTVPHTRSCTLYVRFVKRILQEGEA